VTSGLSGYVVYVNDTRVYHCDAETFSYSYYTSRDLPGATYTVKLGAIFEQPVAFSDVTNFIVTDGNSLEHEGGDEATAGSVQVLTQEEWNTFPVGVAWTVNATFGADPDEMIAEPMISVVNTQIGLDLKESHGRYSFFSGVCYEDVEDPMEGDRIRLILVKKGASEFDYLIFISRSNGTAISRHVCNGLPLTFPVSIAFHSNTTGLRLENCTIGLENAMSISIPVTLRTSGDVTVDGDQLTLDEAVTTAFNGDNLILSDAQYKLSVPLNVKPTGDSYLTPVQYTISLDPAITMKHALVEYTGNENLIKSDTRNYFTNLQVDISISGIILKSDDPFTVIEGSSSHLRSCVVDLTMNNCVIDAPEIQLVTEPDDQHNFPTNAGDQVTIDISNSTLVMNSSSGLITLDDTTGPNFTGVNLTLSDNLIYQKDDLSCFCFASTGSIDFCSLPNIDVKENAFLLSEVCSGCKDKICTPDQNEIVDIPPDVSYLESDYGVTNINNPAVLLDATGEVIEIKGAIKTIDGMAIGSITKPGINLWPPLLERTNSNTDIDKCLFMPLSGKSRVNISMNKAGTIDISDNIIFTSPEECYIKKTDDYKAMDVFPGEIFYVKGEDHCGLRTIKYALSFPGDIVFDEQDINKFYGAAASNADVFKGLTSTDAASGAISWKVESLPIDGDPVNGYEAQRDESFYEPLPEVTENETLSFYYKKQYIDQQFSILFEDENGVTHTIRNTPLPSGTRGWYLTSDAVTLDWQQAVIAIKDEKNIETSELPMSGKLMRLTIHHQSASASSTVPAWMLFDRIAFQEVNSEVFDEQDPSTFVGTGGSDGWDGLTSTDAFTGTKSFKVVIKKGNTTTSDEWTGFDVGVDLPVSTNKRKFTFSYKKTDQSSFVAVKLHMMDLETSTVTVFEVSEQDNAEALAGAGWPIPRKNDARWNQVFVDLYSARGPGNTDRADDSPMPVGKCVKLELLLSGTEGAECLFDNIDFIQDVYRQEISTDEIYQISPDYSEEYNISGWKLNALGSVGKNTIISYGTSNEVLVEENYNQNSDPEANLSIQTKLEIEKFVTVSSADFPNAYIYWREKGTPIGYIELQIECSDGKTYPLAFSPTGSSLQNSRGVFKCKDLNDESETRHSYKIVEVFEHSYKDLARLATPVTPTRLISMKVLYNASLPSNWYTCFEYPEIKFPPQETTPPFSISVSNPVDMEQYGQRLPVELTANKEISMIKILAKNNNIVIKKWEYPITSAEQVTFSGSCDLTQINNFQLNDDGELQIVIEATDIFGSKISEDRTIFIRSSTPTISLINPSNGSSHNRVIQLKGISDIPLSALNYQISDDANTILHKGSFDYVTGILAFDETVAVDVDIRFQTGNVQVYGT